MIFVHRIAQALIFRTADVKEFRPRPDHKQLPNFFLEGHLAQSFLGPLLAITIKPDRQGLVLGLGQGGQAKGDER